MQDKLAINLSFPFSGLSLSLSLSVVPSSQSSERDVMQPQASGGASVSGSGRKKENFTTSSKILMGRKQKKGEK